MWHRIDYVLMRQFQKTYAGMFQSSVGLIAGLITNTTCEDPFTTLATVGSTASKASFCWLKVEGSECWCYF